MRTHLRATVAAGLAAVALAGCSGAATSGASSTSGASAAWSTPNDVIAGITAAGFKCAAPSASPGAQVLTKDPFSGKDLGGNALIRCDDVQIMLAKGKVDDGFALLVACQVVPPSIRQSPEWAAPVLEGPNFLILPVDLSKGWPTTAKPADFQKKFGGTESTFGTVYDRACAGKQSGASGSEAPAASAPAPEPSAS